MKVYDSMSLRETAQSAGLAPDLFEPLLDFVEWTGIAAPVLALGRARTLRGALEDVLVHGAGRWSMRDYQECRFSLESAARFQHSSGDAAARLVFVSLVETAAPAELHLSNFERSLPDGLRRHVVTSALREMRKSGDWRYLSAFSNTVKHMSLVEHDCHVVLGESAELRFAPFEFKGHNFPECPHSEFERLLSRCKDSLCEVLLVLHDHLASQPSG